MATNGEHATKTRQSGSPSEILDRLPPQSLEAERGVLGSMLLDSDVCDEISLLLRADDFYADRHRVLFHHLIELHNEGMQHIDVTLLHERLKDAGQLEQIGGIVYLGELIHAVPHAANATYYADIVAQKSTLRSLIQTSTEVLKDCYSDGQDPRELLSKAEDRIFRILDGRGTTEVSRLEDILALAFERIDARVKNGGGISGIATGLIDLDHQIGGLQRSELAILAARPSMGKTALATTISENVAIRTGECVLFVSLEMSKLELTERIMCSFARVNGHKLRNGFLGAEAQQKLVEKASEMSQAPLYIDDTPSRTVSEIAAAARRLKHREGLSLIVIDYLQLIEPDNARDPRQEQVAKIARRLKGLARSLEVPVLCLAQLNRQAEATKDNIPRLSHLRESGAIEQDADVVMFIHREEYYANSEEEKAEHAGKAEIIIAKQRNGPVGTIPICYLSEFVRFESLDERDDPGDTTDFGDYFE
ncbi:Replicative DNA helicase [Planctomycetales bacterium 10988]|nr:Replicative DNA helicase [Planctomycetales bacterium 10988]